jgi:hypothetical protein
MNVDSAKATDDQADLSRQIDALLQESAALNAAFQRIRMVRLMLFLGLIAIAAVTVWKFYTLGDHLRSKENLDKLAATAQARLEKHNDAYMGEVKKLVDHASPVLTEAFYDQAKKDLPDFANDLSKERDTFAANLKTQLTDKLDSHFTRVQSQADKAIAEGFPDMKDEERKKRMVANIEVATQRLARRYYLNQVDDRLNGADGVFANLDKFPAAEKPAKGAPPLEDQFTAKLLDLLTHRLARPDVALR